MPEINFKFSIDQEVKTALGEDGIISMLARDDGGNCYHVKTAKGSDWYKEAQLSAR